MQVATDAMVKTPQPGDPSYEVFNKVGVCSMDRYCAEVG